MRVLPFAVLALSGCAADASGIWMVFEPFSDEADVCEDSFSENFDGDPKGGGGGGGDSEWEYTDEHQGSGIVYFFQIYLDGNNEAVLVTAKKAFPGIWEGDHWTFEWADTTTDTLKEVHEEGYGFAMSTFTESKTTYELTMTGADTAEITVTGSGLTTLLYVESDKWDPDDTQDEVDDVGQIPSADYIENDDDEDQLNLSDEDDCSKTDEGDYCEMRFETSCTGSADVTAERVKTDDQDAFEYLDGSGNGGGS